MRKPIILVALFTGAAALRSTPVLAELIIAPTYTTAWETANTNFGGALTAGVQNAITTLENTFSNDVTINLTFDWSGAGEGGYVNVVYGAAYDFATLPQLKTLLQDHARAHPENTAINTAVQYLPETFPNPGGDSRFLVLQAQIVALSANGGGHLNSNQTDATVVIQTDTDMASIYGVALHEITHAMGRADLGSWTGAAGGYPPFLMPLDLFKYNPGTNTLDPTLSMTSFSIDGGATYIPGGTFSQVGDSSDWQSSIPFPASYDVHDPFNAYYVPGTSFYLTPVGKTVMNALGWDPIVIADVPEIDANGLGAVVGLIVGGLGLVERRRHGR